MSDTTTALRRARLLHGVPESAAGAAAALVIAETRAPAVVLVSSSQGRAEAGVEDTLFFLHRLGAPAPVVRSLPPAGEAGAGAFESECDLLAVIAALRERTSGAESSPLLVAATPGALMRPCPGATSVANSELELRPGMKIGVRRVAEILAADFDYDHEALCEAPGQFAVRGGIVDVYPLNAHAPVRADFFGDEVESLRVFDPVTQRSEGGPLASLVVAAPVAASGEASPGGLFDHLPPDTLFVWLDPAEADYAAWPRPPAALSRALISPAEETPDWFAPAGASVADWAGESLEWHAAEPESRILDEERPRAESRLRTRLLRRLASWWAEGRRVTLVCETEGGAERLREIVAELREDWLTEPDRPAAPPTKRPRRAAAKTDSDVRPAAALAGFDPEIVVGRTGEGFLLPAGAVSAAYGAPGGWALCTERELSGARRRTPAALRVRRMPVRSRIEQILDFHELADGDLLVHLRHGVCRYRGVNRPEIRGAPEEVVSLEFADGVILHTPLREAHLLSKYVGLTRILPKLGRIGSDGWQKTRKAAEAASVDFAAELLRMQAKRHAIPGHAFPPDAATPRMGEFERAFPHRETPDQTRAIAETKTDMERPSPMDRLVCGDVGFGKTEVAVRAAFKCVLDGRQVALLCPTTILAQQHYNTFRERFANFPVSIELLSRFRKPARRRRIVEAFNAGEIDILVGTHAILSPTVKPPALGLAIIDEEHRFGVRHKEAFKRLRDNVDVLAMSATPIPRTLHLALMGARDLSVIETPPKERLLIRTVVREYDARVVVEAVRHEVSRGGQVFYLHNRVDTIESVAARLREWLPGLRIGVGHGQMDEEELEEMMTRFVAGEFDLLVCTTIIETGLDIPNCNTLIIEGADRFGLAQLYQLRGRVGRFNRQAYAYLLLHKHGRMLDQARKRLGAIRQFNQLGAGFRIAMRDLELRGAGNLLGREQSGHIAGVGFELYCQLLRQSVARLRGDRVASAVRAEIRPDFVRHSPLPDSGARDPEPGYDTLREDEVAQGRCADITATLPEGYIGEIRLRIDAFRRLAMAASVAEVEEIVASLEDRFGPPPPEARAFFLMSEIRCVAESRGVVSVETEGSRLKCKLARPRPDGSQYLKVGANFPRLERSDPFRRLEEIRAWLLRHPKV